MADQSCTMKNNIKVNTNDNNCGQQNGHVSPTGSSGSSNGQETNGHLLAPVVGGVSTAPYNSSQTYHGGATQCDQRPVSPSSRGSSPQNPSTPHVVHVHVQPGETFTVRVGEQMQRIPGPATVRMVSNNGPPMPMPMQVPPGHMVHQIIDENGILTHVILSPQPGMPAGPPMTGPSNTQPTPYYSGYGPQYGPAPTHPSQYGAHQGAPAPPLNMHAGPPPPHMHSSPPPSHQCNNHPTGPSQGPPPSHHVRSDERTMKQKMRLQKKLVNRQQEGNYSYIPQRPKNKVNGIEIQHGRHPESIHSSSSSNDGQDTEDERIKDMLSSMSQPEITDIEARSALVRIYPPECNIPEMTDLTYLLQLAGREGKYETVYSGDATEITLKDLIASHEYQLKTCAVLDYLKGQMTEPVVFKTLSCQPDAPQPPKCYQRSKTSISLKWTATSDNGAKVSSYTLEFDQGRKDGTFVEVYNGISRQFKVLKLQASTGYTFRLAAINSVGKSAFSEPVVIYTSGSVPMQPDPPMLSEECVNEITVSWIKRPNDDDFTLQMEDEETGHGFVSQYNGSQLSHKVDKLRRNTEYKFRLSANNEEGSSKWSEVVCCRTLPGKPGPPGKPQTKGKIHSTHFRITWDQPKDNGGSPVESYILELDRGKGFEKVYEGPEKECSCDHLEPGQTYRVQVRCSSKGGISQCSDISSVTTTAVAPGQCQPPKLHGKPRATSLHLRWSHPEYNGGSAVTEFEVEMVSADNETRIVYSGHDQDCLVAGLAPGRSYLFQVRAHNRAGFGPWSDSLEIISGPGVPDAPKAPVCHCKSPQSAVVSWEEPVNNGATVTEYRLEWLAKEEYTQIYTGPATSHEVKGLTPASTYNFRVVATNSAGTGPVSPVTECTMPASSPGGVTSLRGSSTATSVTVSWKIPSDNGSEILSYNIDLGEKQLVSLEAIPGVLEHTIEELLPETTYKIRVQAVNSIGVGSFSQPIKISTHALPPQPPRLECVTTGANSLKLKWGEGKNPDLIRYSLEMLRENGSFFQVYSGPLHNHKVSKLMEMTVHSFRICASNDAGDGPYSNVFTFNTSKAQPPAVKEPRVSEVSTHSCSVSWNPLKPMGRDTIQYMLQLQTPNREQEYKVIYKGPDTSYRLQDLEPKTEYVVRVCAIRCSRHQEGNSAELTGAFSPGIRFTTPSLLVERRPSAKSMEQKLIEPKHWTDQQIAMFVVGVFVLSAVLIAVVVQNIYQHTRV